LLATKHFYSFIYLLRLSRRFSVQCHCNENLHIHKAVMKYIARGSLLYLNEPPDVSLPSSTMLSLRRRIALVFIAWLDRQDRILNREEFISRGSHPPIASFETRKGAITSTRILRERIYDIPRRLIIPCFSLPLLYDTIYIYYSIYW